ncbi:MAG: hypothetical protein WAQ08_10865 [Aquabacterium sp.]|uniref:hypothetical protein n=1 Tax=Aquabacterium sp. TaxID=1872578 RepID=UPI003BB058F0
MPSARRGAITCAFDSAAVLEAMIAMALAEGRTKKQFALAAGLDPADLHKYTKPDGPKMSTATLSRVAKGNGFSLSILLARTTPRSG